MGYSENRNHSTASTIEGCQKGTLIWGIVPMLFSCLDPQGSLLSGAPCLFQNGIWSSALRLGLGSELNLH